ncbi:hypothetical protein FRC07_012911 [Ceratobasidium sp. 392]|nr:hypothetical protein FRC07_012911 [Ceratobasidium sp. 392]
MSKKDREYPPSSSRYHRSSLNKGGLGSSSTKVHVLPDGHPERGYDSEAVRDSPAPQVTAGYYTEGQPSTSKRSSKDLYRTALDPGRRAHGSRMSSMPAGPQTSFGYPYDVRANHDNHGPVQGMLDTDDSAAEQNSSLRRVKKDRERRHRERDRDAQPYDRPDARTVPPDVWMQQVVPPQEPKTSRSSKRESRSARRQDETPLPTQPDLPRTYPHTGPAPLDYQKHAHSQPSYPYAQQPASSVPYRPANVTPIPPPPHPDHYRPNPPVSAPPDNYAALVAPTPENQAQIKPRYEYVIDDRAGLRSPPPIEIPHAFPPNASYEFYGQPDSPVLPLPRTRDQLRAEGLIPASPAPHRRTHRSGRSEDVTATNGFFADGTPSGPYGSQAEHARQPLRHRPSRSELGLGPPPGVAPDESHESLVRPVHVGRSASETIVPQQLPTPGMFGTGLAVTPAQKVPAPGGILMHPQLQESFAESANASRAPVNAAMANAAILGYPTGVMESDSSSAKDKEVSSRRTMKKDKKPRRSSKQPETLVQPLPQLQPPTDAAYPEPNRQMQAEAVRQLIIEPSPPPVVVPYPSGRRPRTTSGRSAVQDEEQEPEPDTVVYQTPEEPNPRRASRTSLSPPLLASRSDMTFAGAAAALAANAPRGDGGYEMRGGVEDDRTRKLSAGAEERGRRPSIETRKVEDEHVRPVHLSARKSMESESSFQSYESAVLAASTANTYEQDYASAKDAMSPRSNYYSVAASVRSVPQSVTNEVRNTTNDMRNMANEARNIANEAREMGATTVIMQSPPAVKTMPAPPTTLPRQAGVRTSSAPSTSALPAFSKHISAPPKAPALVPPTPVVRPAEVVPQPSREELNVRPRAPSGSMPAPPPLVDVAPHRATVDAHMRDNAPPPMTVDEEGRLARTPAVSQTMPIRAPRHSLTRQVPPPIGIVTPVASPPQPHAQTQPSDAQASALPKNIQQQQPTGSSKESLVENVKGSGKTKSSSRWFWNKSKPTETSQKAPPPVRAQAPSPAPPSITSPPASAPPQRVRHPSLLNGLMMGTPMSKSKKVAEPVPPSGPRLSGEMYPSLGSTPSSLSLEVEPEPVKKGMFATLKNTLRRTPSTSKIGHKFSQSMSRLPGTLRETAPAPPPPGAPLARSLSAKDSAWPMSPQRAKEPLRPMKDNADVPPPPPVVPPPVPTPPPVVAPPPPAPVPAPAAPVPVPPSVAALPPPPAVPKDRAPLPPKETRAPEVVPVKDDRRLLGKDVPIIDKGRSGASYAPRAPALAEPPKSSRTLVDETGRLVDINGRPVGSISRPVAESGSRGTAGQRSSVQAAPPLPPHPRAASPPLVGRPVAATRVPANGPSGIFASGSQSRPATQPASAPNTSHTSSSRGQSRDRSRSSRDPVPIATPGPLHSSLRTPRPREAAPAIAPPAEPSTTPELSLPTPEATPRSSPTGGAMFDNHDPTQAPPPPREKSRPANIVIPRPDLAAAIVQKFAAETANGGPHLRFDHRQKRAVSIASQEAVTGQEGHFRSETSSIRTVTPGPSQTTFPLRDPLAAAQDWTAIQLREDKLAARRDSITARLEEDNGRRKLRGGIKRSKGSRKPGVAFDFPGPVIDEDGEEKEDTRQADIELTYELERMKKRYK